jgi:hypothetical protein
VESPGGIAIFDVASGHCLRDVASAFTAEKKAIAWAPDGKTLATGGAPAKLWDATSGSLRRDLPAEANHCAFSPDGKYLALATRGREFEICRTETGAVAKTYTLPDDADHLSCKGLAWSSDGKRLAAADNMGSVFVCDVETDQPPTRITQRKAGNWGNDICWLNHDSALAVTGGTWGARVWDYEPGRMSRLLREIPCYFSRGALSPACGFVALAGPNLIRLHRLDDGQLVRTLLPLGGGHWAVVSPDGSPGVEKEFVYVVQTENGQETLTPEEFSKKYGWKNDAKTLSLSRNAMEPKGED